MFDLLKFYFKGLTVHKFCISCISILQLQKDDAKLNLVETEPDELGLRDWVSSRILISGYVS